VIGVRSAPPIAMNPIPTLVSCLLATSLLAQDSPELQQTLREWRAIRAAETVAIARVVEVHASPGVWCGVVASKQKVTYRIERVVDGKQREGTVDVSHLLVAGSPLVSPHAPLLRPELFYEGAQAVLCLRTDEQGDLGVDDAVYGARIVSPPRRPDVERCAIVAAVLCMPELSAYWHLEEADAAPRCLLNDAVPEPFTMHLDGKLVEFAAPEQLRDKRHVEITALQRDGDTANVTFRMAHEGVVGSAKLKRTKGAWRIVDSDVAEHRKDD